MNKQFVSLLFRSSIFYVVSAISLSIAHAVEIPRDTRGTVIQADTIKWEWNSHSAAVHHQVNVFQADVNGNFHVYEIVDRVYGQDYKSRNLSAGKYAFTVQAVDNNNRYTTPTQRSAAVTIGSGSSESTTISSNEGNLPSNASINIPTNVKGIQTGDNQIRWEWGAVEGARDYEIYLDGADRPTDITKNEFLVTSNLAAGDHSVTVTALDSDYQRTAQSVSVTVNVNDGWTAASNSDADNNSNNNIGNNVAPPPPENDNGLIDPSSWNYSEVSQKPGYRLVFSDEFNSNSLNPSRWNSQLRWDGSWNGERYEYRLINGESQFYVNTLSKDQEHLDKVASVYNPFKFDGNRLAIRSIVNPLKNRDRNTNYNPKNPNSNQDNYEAYGPLSLIAYQQPFLSGVIASYDKFSLKYGYIEARIKIPSHVGTFPAFWLHHQESGGNTRKTEIDIMENLGHKPTHMYTAAHYYKNVVDGIGGEPNPVKPTPYGQIITGIDHSQDYHVYAVEWKEGHIRYLIDGVQVSEVWDSAFNHEELYIIMNLAVGGIWTNLPTSSGGTGRANAGNAFPTRQDVDNWGNPALEIDYIRVYKAQ